MRRRLHLLTVDATSGPMAIVGTLMCLIALLLALVVRAPDLLPGWADPLNLCLTATMVFAPVAAGVAALHAGNLRRARVLALAATAPDGQWRALTHAALAVFAWSGLAWTAFAAITLLGSDLAGPLTPAMWLLPLQALALVALSVVVGTAVGTRLTWYLTGPLVALTMYGVLFWLDISGSRWSPVYSDIYYQARFEPNARLLASVTCLIGAAAIGLGAVALRTTRRRLQLVAGGTAGLLLVLATSGLAVAGPDDTQLRSGGGGRCSSTDDLTLCVWPENASRLESSLEALVRAVSVAAPVMSVPRAYYEPGLRPSAPDARPYVVPGFGESGYFGAAVRAVVPAPCGSSTERAAFELQALVYERTSPGSTTSELGAAPVARQPLVQQRTWAAIRLAMLAHCG